MKKVSHPYENLNTYKGFFHAYIHACMYATLISDMRSSKIPDIQNSAKGGRCGWSQNI